MKKKIIRYSLISFITLVIGLFTFIASISFYVSYKSTPFILDKENPNVTCKTGLVLGTSKYMRNGNPNPFFINRINAATDLLRKHDIEFIIVSGDNRTSKYNEPKVMRIALEQKGVNKKKIVMDYAGLRTLDSVVRANKIFQQDRFIIISQLFHVERAVFIARYHGIEAFGYPADDVPLEKSYSIHFREYFARVKMFLDLYIFNTQPRFLGKKEIIQ